MMSIVWIFIFILFVIVGVVVGFFVWKFIVEVKINGVVNEVRCILDEVNCDVEVFKKEVFLEVKDEIYIFCIEVELEICDCRSEL